MRKNKDYLKCAYNALLGYIKTTPKGKTPRLGVGTPLKLGSKGIIRAEYTRAQKTETLFELSPSGKLTLFCPNITAPTWAKRMYNFTQIVNPVLVPHNRRLTVRERTLIFQIQKMTPMWGTQMGHMVWCDYLTLRTSFDYYNGDESHTIRPDQQDFWGIKELANPRLRPVKDWSRRKWYKVMNPTGYTGFAGFHWDLPKNGKPGAWHEVEGPLIMCANGIHVCPAKDVGHWWTLGGAIIVEMEVEGPVYYDTRDTNRTKFLVRKARVKRIVGNLSTQECREATEIFSKVDIAARVATGRKLPKLYRKTYTYTETVRYERTFTGTSTREVRQKAKRWIPSQAYRYGEVLAVTLKEKKGE